VTRPDDAPRLPDGPTPAREQLPLPRRQRQSHLEPRLRSPGGTGTGTPFAAFAADNAAEPTRNAPTDRPDPAEHPDRRERQDRAAAFHAGARRGRSRVPRRRGTGRSR